MTSSITRIDSLRRKIARRLLKKNNLKPLSRFSSLFTCHNHTTPYPMIELSWDESLTNCRRTVRPSLIVITRWCTCWGGSSSFRAGNGTRPRTLESSSLYRWLWCFKKKSRYRYYRVFRSIEKRGLVDSIPFGLRCVVIELNGKNVGLGSHIGTVSLERKITILCLSYLLKKYLLLNAALS